MERTRSEGERDEMKLEMLLLLLCAKRQTDADARNFYGFNPPGARRASEGGKKENAYGSINAFIWPLSSLPPLRALFLLSEAAGKNFSSSFEFCAENYTPYAPPL